LSPLVSTLMFQATGSILPVILLLVGMCALSLVCLIAAPQYVDDAEGAVAPESMSRDGRDRS
jgi:hypothetical protein